MFDANIIHHGMVMMYVCSKRLNSFIVMQIFMDVGWMERVCVTFDLMASVHGYRCSYESIGNEIQCAAQFSRLVLKFKSQCIKAHLLMRQAVESDQRNL